MAPAITCVDSCLSRQQLDRRTNQPARAFVARGAKPDTCITISLPNGIAFTEAMIATWKVGAIPQPLSAKLPRAELNAIVDLAIDRALTLLAFSAFSCRKAPLQRAPLARTIDSLRTLGIRRAF